MRHAWNEDSTPSPDDENSQGADETEDVPEIIRTPHDDVTNPTSTQSGNTQNTQVNEIICQCNNNMYSVNAVNYYNPIYN